MNDKGILYFSDLQVLQSIRTATTYQGQEVVAVVIHDFRDDAESRKLKLAIKNHFRNNNVARDFVRPGCVCTTMKRGKSSRSRKCSVIFKAKIEQRLWEQLEEGKIAFLVAFCFFVHCFCYLLMEWLYYFLPIQMILCSHNIKPVKIPLPYNNYI